jgi:hypothetical protein
MPQACNQVSLRLPDGTWARLQPWSAVPSASQLRYYDEDINMCGKKKKERKLYVRPCDVHSNERIYDDYCIAG